ncbi:MAG: TIGR03016 family PEP-CTERM system-associated outer membrane protein [Woeseiaceae bacterium]
MKKIILTLCAMTLTTAAYAIDWDLETFVNASIVHTDNVTLAGDGLEESDTILVLAPQFNLTGESARVDLDLSYNPQAVFYDNTDGADQVFHVLDGIMTTELLDDRFFLDLVGSKFQTIVTPDGNFPLDNIPASNNRADATVLTVNPYWQQRLGRADLRVTAAHTRTDLDDESVDPLLLGNLQSNRSNTAGINIGSIPSERGITWSFDYNYQRIEYDDFLPFEFQRGALQLGFWANDNVRVFSTVGRETAFDDFFDGSPDSSFWEGGVQYAPSERFNFEVAAGDRSFGTTVRGALTYNTRRTRTTFTYAETPTTQGALFAGRRPLRDIDNLDGLLDRANAADRIVQKRGELSTTVELNRTTINWRIFSERQLDRFTADGTPLPDNDLTGAAFRFDWRFGPRTNLNFTADTAKRTGDLGDGDFWRIGVGAVYNVSSRLTLGLNIEHLEQNGGGFGGVGGQGFDANRGTLTIGMRL